MILSEPGVRGDTAVSHLYAHVPFCPRKCDYCAFVTHVGSLRLVDPYVRALKLEARELALARPRGPLKTVYFGGGTPSLLPPDSISDLLSHLDQLFGLAANCEITLEAHPQTVDETRLHDFKSVGITRLSFGGESLDGTELAQLGRDHDGARVLTVVELARAAGLQTVNVDFMYAIPGQTPASWERTLRTIVRAEPDHLSLYPLSIEPHTVFERKRRRNLLRVPDDDTAAAMYDLACETLRAAGYDHYEVANWALPGHRCRHNLAYWHNREYFAIGVGAHAYLKPYRTENIGQTRRYIDCVHSGESPVRERVHLNAATQFSETMMLRLRLLEEGVDLDEIRNEFGVDVPSRFAHQIELLTGGGLVDVNRGRLVLTERAVPVANEVWQCFMS